MCHSNLWLYTYSVCTPWKHDRRSCLWKINNAGWSEPHLTTTFCLPGSSVIIIHCHAWFYHLKCDRALVKVTVNRFLIHGNSAYFDILTKLICWKYLVINDDTPRHVVFESCFCLSISIKKGGLWESPFSSQSYSSYQLVLLCFIQNTGSSHHFSFPFNWCYKSGSWNPMLFSSVAQR